MRVVSCSRSNRVLSPCAMQSFLSGIPFKVHWPTAKGAQIRRYRIASKLPFCLCLRVYAEHRRLHAKLRSAEASDRFCAHIGQLSVLKHIQALNVPSKTSK